MGEAMRKRAEKEKDKMEKRTVLLPGLRRYEHLFLLRLGKGDIELRGGRRGLWTG